MECETLKTTGFGMQFATARASRSWFEFGWQYWYSRSMRIVSHWMMMTGS
jgi:hypothetical protein